jgi:hypothetical protein
LPDGYTAHSFLADPVQLALAARAGHAADADDDLNLRQMRVSVETALTVYQPSLLLNGWDCSSM